MERLLITLSKEQDFIDLNRQVISGNFSSQSYRTSYP